MHGEYHGCWYELSTLTPNIYIPGELLSLPCLLGLFGYQPAHRKECPAWDPRRLGAPEGGRVKPLTLLAQREP